MASRLSRLLRPSLWPTFAILSWFVIPTSTLGFDCGQVMDDGVHWNFKPLAGQHVVSTEIVGDPVISNWTFALDLCNALEPNKDADDKHQCPQGTMVCGVMREREEGNEKDDSIRKWVAFAGRYSTNLGIHLDVKPTRLKNSPSHADADREGVRLEMSGGRSPFGKAPDSVPQKALIEMICDNHMTGWEPAKPPGSQSERLERRDADNKGDENSPSQALKFLGYKNEPVGKSHEVWGVLRLEWRTKYACEDASSIPTEGSSKGWGFFTWFIIILFLAISAYLIFGSWLNINRYGARGFDAVPHADTIRDIPYIVKDMFRRFQAGDSRGGYSAV